MISESNLGIDGNSNVQAGRDVAGRDIVHNYPPTNNSPIEFYEQDIIEVIDCFSRDISNNSILTIIDDFLKVDLAQVKNPLNNLSSRYFQIIQEESLPYFLQIDTFLKAPENSDGLAKYNATTAELRHKITVYRDQYPTFEQIFDVLYNHILSNNQCISSDRRLVLTFLHFMYWNCDIGIKEHVETT